MLFYYSIIRYRLVFLGFRIGIGIACGPRSGFAGHLRGDMAAPTRPPPARGTIRNDYSFVRVTPVRLSSERMNRSPRVGWNRYLQPMACRLEVRRR